jgi:hypothetical protein
VQYWQVVILRHNVPTSTTASTLQQKHMRTFMIKQRFAGRFESFILCAASVKAATRTVSAPSRQGVRCMAEPEAQASEGSSVDIWLGRAAMVAFTAVLTTEIVSGKGVFAVSPRTDYLLLWSRGQALHTRFAFLADRFPAVALSIEVRLGKGGFRVSSWNPP